MPKFSLSNSRAYLIFLVVSILSFVASGVPAFYYNDYSAEAIALPAVIFASIVIFAAIYRPTFFSIELTDDLLQIWTTVDQGAEPTLLVPRRELAGFDILESNRGVRKSLVIYRRSTRGLLRSPSYLMFLISKPQLASLTEAMGQPGKPQA